MRSIHTLVCINNLSETGYVWKDNLTVGEKYEIFEEHMYDGEIHYRLVDDKIQLAQGGFPASWFVSIKDYELLKR